VAAARTASVRGVCPQHQPAPPGRCRFAFV